MDLIEAEARKTLPSGTVFSVGSLSDGTGHGHVTLNVQGEYVEQAQAALGERFPSLRVVPISAEYYSDLLEQKGRDTRELERQLQIAQVRQEVESACESKGTLYDISIIACQVGTRVAMVVYVQGEHRDQIEQWLLAVFGGNHGFRIDVKPLSGKRYWDLHRQRKGAETFAGSAMTV